MSTQRIAWGPIAFVIVIFFTSIGLIGWGLASAPHNAASSSDNSAVKSES